MKSRLLLFLVGVLFFSALQSVHAQQQKEGEVIHLDNLTIDKKKKHSFQGRDSILTVYIDTLVMKDKANLNFYGKKDVKLVVKNAYIAKDAIIYGQGLQNNGTNFDIDINFDKLESLYIIAKGQNANNGTKTFPNGDGGNVILQYSTKGFDIQTSNKKDNHYLRIDNTEGGLSVTPSTELTSIYARIATSPTGLRGLPQGQIYSGSPGKKGTTSIEKK